MSLESGTSSSEKRESITNTGRGIVVYGTSWCGMSQMIRRYFEKKDISYQYFDLEDDTDAIDKLRWITGGYAHHPTVIIDGQALIEPSMEELEEVMERNGYV